MTAVTSGCSEPAAPNQPQIGEKFTYLDDEGGRATLTYRGTIERAGRQWHHFDMQGMFPFPLEDIRYLDVETGGQPRLASAHGEWLEGEYEPFMEWHHTEGDYTKQVEINEFHAKIEDDGNTRTVTITNTWVAGANRGDTAAKEIITYKRGDIVPQTMRRMADQQGDGSWFYDATARRI